MNLFKKLFYFLSISIFFIGLNCSASTNGLQTSENDSPSIKLIFPIVPSRFTIPPNLFNTPSNLQRNTIFIGSEFCFSIPRNSNLEEVANSEQSSSIKLRITDSSNQQFNLTPEIIKPKNKKTLTVIKSEELSTAAIEGDGIIEILLNDEPIAQDKVFISKTIANRLSIPEELSTEIESVVLINKSAARRLKFLIGGINFYKKELLYNDSVLLEDKGLTHATLFPRNEFGSIKSRVLKGNEVFTVRSTLKKHNFENDILVIINTPFGQSINKLTISKCSGKACGEN